MTDHPLHRSLVALVFLVAILLLALPPSFYLWSASHLTRETSLILFHYQGMKYGLKVTKSEGDVHWQVSGVCQSGVDLSGPFTPLALTRRPPAVGWRCS